MIKLAFLAAAIAAMIVPPPAGPAPASPELAVQQAAANVPVAALSRAKFPGEDPATVDGLALINQLVNQAITYQTDQEHYGVREKAVSWPEDRRGDCEDYALSKMVSLLNLGVPIVQVSRLRFATVEQRGQTYGHAVLEVQLPNGAAAFMDNNFDELMTRRELEAHGYRFFDW
jgi:predicted transglutaminase-like cysteine proteinase